MWSWLVRQSGHIKARRVANKTKNDRSHIITVFSMLSPKVSLKTKKIIETVDYPENPNSWGTFIGKMQEFLSTFPDHTPLCLLRWEEQPLFPDRGYCQLLFVVILVPLLNWTFGPGQGRDRAFLWHRRVLVQSFPGGLLLIMAKNQFLHKAARAGTSCSSKATLEWLSKAIMLAAYIQMRIWQCFL